MLKLEKARVGMEGELIGPVVKDGLKVMSIAFLLSDRDSAVIWRGPMKANVIEQLLRDVNWGELDYLVIDCPPGTGDEPLSVCQLVGDADGAVIVTTPQDVATANVRRSIRFCGDLDLPVLGVVENMSGFVCPACGKTTDIFGSGGGEKMAAEMDVPFLGRVPLDLAVGKAGDEGTMSSMRYRKTEAGLAMERVIAPLLALSKASPRK
jgi:Mrp family chromosome partitioning ATPase